MGMNKLELAHKSYDNVIFASNYTGETRKTMNKDYAKFVARPDEDSTCYSLYSEDVCACSVPRLRYEDKKKKRCETHLFFHSWGAGIRTPIDRSRVGRPTIERHPITSRVWCYDTLSWKCCQALYVPFASDERDLCEAQTYIMTHMLCLG
jgi:hypothetical protein